MDAVQWAKDMMIDEKDTMSIDERLDLQEYVANYEKAHRKEIKEEKALSKEEYLKKAHAKRDVDFLNADFNNLKKAKKANLNIKYDKLVELEKAATAQKDKKAKATQPAHD